MDYNTLEGRIRQTLNIPMIEPERFLSDNIAKPDDYICNMCRHSHKIVTVIGGDFFGFDCDIKGEDAECISCENFENKD